MVWSERVGAREFEGPGSCCASAGELIRTSHRPMQATRPVIATGFLHFPVTQFPVPLDGIEADQFADYWHFGLPTPLPIHSLTALSGASRKTKSHTHRNDMGTCVGPAVQTARRDPGHASGVVPGHDSSGMS